MVLFRPRTDHVSLSLMRLLMIGCVGATVIVAPGDAAAQGVSPSGWSPGGGQRQARLSRDLEQRLATGNIRNETIILTGSAARIARIAGRHGLQIRKWLETGAVIDVPAGSLRDIADDGEVDQLSTNQVLRSQMAVTNETIGADLVVSGAWSAGAQAYDGSGVGVALIDSGVAMLPQLGGRVVARFDFTEARGRGLDAYGHGTHVAGIIAAAGSRRGGNGPGNITGVAPGAHIVSLKVLDAEGAGTADNVIEAIDFAIKVRERFNIKVINLSLGGAVLQPAADDPICQAVERAYRAGIVVVASAGNFGRTADGTRIFGGITTPGISPYAVTVGSVNTQGTPWRDDDEVSSYSSRGPTRFDHLLKPDLVAPGNRIESLAAPDSTLVKRYPELVIGEGKNASLRLSGTSMAAGVVSGAAAILVEAHPAATPFVVRTTFQLGINPQVGGLLQAGAGSLDLQGTLSLRNSRGLAFSDAALWRAAIQAGDITPTRTREEAIWRGDDGIVWGTGSGEDLTVVWGSSETVVLGSYRTVVWGSNETVVWGSNETVVWGSSKTVVWGSNDETVVWGSSWNDETVVWGSNWDPDSTVVWGSNDETVVWGSSWGDETVVWGSSVSPSGDW